MSCLALAHWAEKARTSHLSPLLRQLFSLDNVCADFGTYEKFHPTWEAMRCYAFVQEDNILNKLFKPASSKVLMKLSNFYNGRGRPFQFDDLEIYIERDVTVVHSYNDIRALLLAVLTPEGKLKSNAHLQSIYCLAGNSVGCDSIAFHVTKNEDVVIRAVSSKYSDREDIFQEISELKDGHEKLHGLFKELFPKAKELREKRLYFIANCWRGKRNYQEHPSLFNSLILTNEDLSPLYSTFNQRPQLGTRLSLSSPPLHQALSK